MELKDLELLFQLVKGLEESANNLEKSFNDSDKEEFNSSKSALLDFQKKIALVLK